MDRIAPTRRPVGPAQGFQRWHRLLFSHWEVPAEVIRPLIHPRLAVDDFEGHCYVGLVAFEMRGVRPFRWAPSLPGARDFPELNLRTYVHLGGQEPGVTFFSLDAASWAVVQGARLGWGLAYFHAYFPEHRDEGNTIAVRCERRGPPSASFACEYSYGDVLPLSVPGSVEFFLTERYSLYVARGGRLLRARVHHAPYMLHPAQVSHLETNVLSAAGIPQSGLRLPDYFSPGVDVDVFALETV